MDLIEVVKPQGFVEIARLQSAVDEADNRVAYLDEKRQRAIGFERNLYHLYELIGERFQGLTLNEDNRKKACFLVLIMDQ